MSAFKVGDKVVRLQSKFRFIETVVKISSDGKTCVLDYGGGQYTWHGINTLEFPNEDNRKYQGASNRVINSNCAY
tara:strand:+ start:543 stop:767 length:225 start_codon:yes stop_codon:yes gene_type:complete